MRRKNVHAPLPTPCMHLSLSLSFSLSLSLSFSSFPLSLFLFGGEAGCFGGEASPPPPPLDETLTTELKSGSSKQARPLPRRPLPGETDFYLPHTS